MAPLNDMDELQVAWRALSGSPRREGWQTISVAADAPCRILAGRRFPGDEEALLVGFSSPPPQGDANLPEGRGFTVSFEEMGTSEPDFCWIALSRQKSGNLDLFTLMSQDVLSMLKTCSTKPAAKLRDTFLARIRAWQDFMRQARDGGLGSEDELGLVGELEFLEDLIIAGLPASLAVQGWIGPLGGSQDFVLGKGAFEVKSTATTGDLIVRISSLEQLDDSTVYPLFLVASRFPLQDSGMTLPERIALLRSRISEQQVSLDLFNNRLLQAGFLDADSANYGRRFSRGESRILSISDNFPHFSRGRVARAIISARYEIDLELVEADSTSLENALKELGVL